MLCYSTTLNIPYSKANRSFTVTYNVTDFVACNSISNKATHTTAYFPNGSKFLNVWT